jgi:UDP-glucose:(heptosyl)LPS alpha-1,3-glucosyltransferase
LKGLDPLLRSLRLVPRQHQFRLVVVGNPDYSRYQRLAKKLGIDDRVIFHGFCGDSRSMYFAGDFLVHPTFYDPCSLVVLEAMACGLPVITSTSNGAAELLHPPRDGLAVDSPHNHMQLAVAITRMLDRDFRESCTRNAAASARLWTFDDHYRKMMAIFESVADRKRASGLSSRAV